MASFMRFIRHSTEHNERFLSAVVYKTLKQAFYRFCSATFLQASATCPPHT
eukprot:m.3881 g.3881  ORF g.3881 m.3881 type:complete len:51 (-) comp4336_c0_seq1:173-325(-)